MNDEHERDYIRDYIYELANEFKQNHEYSGIDIKLTATNFINDYLVELVDDALNVEGGITNSVIKQKFKNYINATRGQFMLGGRRRKKGKKSRKSRKSKKSKKHHKRKSRRKRR